MVDYDKMKKKSIYLCLAQMSQSGAEQRYVKEAFDTNWITPLGPNVTAFETDIEQWLNRSDSARYVTALSSGTAAIHLALLMCGVTHGDEVICQSFTFCASANPIVYLGATPVLVDSEKESWNMDPVLLEQAIQNRIDKTGKKPKAIIVVHLYGMPADMDRMMEISRKYEIPLIEDAAEAMGACFDNRCCGTLGTYGIFSFNGNKMITTSGGGALISSSVEDKDKALFYATQAREKYPFYHHESIGYNYRMSNVSAGIGRGQMTVLDEHVAHHRRLAHYYRSAFEKVEGIQFHDAPESKYNPNFWLSTILIHPSVKMKKQVEKNYPAGLVAPNENVEALRQLLQMENIETRPLWKPLHLQPVFSSFPIYENGVSLSLFRQGLCLPSGPCVTMEDAQYIVEKIQEFIL